jgi:hypothetical protein
MKVENKDFDQTKKTDAEDKGYKILRNVFIYVYTRLGGDVTSKKTANIRIN